MRTLHRPDRVHDRRTEIAVARAVALVNLVQATDAAGNQVAPAAVAATLMSAGEHDVSLDAGETANVVAVCRELRSVLVATDRDAAAERLNDLLDRHAGRPRLVRHEGWDWHLHADVTDDAPWAAWLAASAALALATMLTGSASLPWGECASDGCGRSFVHDGRGGERRYCSARCSTRERVRRHRLRASAARRALQSETMLVAAQPHDSGATTAT